MKNTAPGPIAERKQNFITPYIYQAVHDFKSDCKEVSKCKSDKRVYHTE